MSRLEERIRAATAQGRKALIPYLPYGYPDRTRFWTELEGLDKGGADVIEIGVPFSDPVADGPVIEEACQECLLGGASLTALLEDLKVRRTSLQAEIVLMGYMNPFLQYGLVRLAKEAAEAGVAGFIVPDLPFEEAEEMRDALLAQGVDLIALVGLNTDEDRLKAYAEIASGFAYFVSVLGTTGARDALPQEVIDKLALARKTFEVPLALGFGIKSPEQLEGPLGEHVDAVVFGSALVAHIAAGGTASEFMERWK